MSTLLACLSLGFLLLRCTTTSSPYAHGPQPFWWESTTFIKSNTFRQSVISKLVSETKKSIAIVITDQDYVQELSEITARTSYRFDATTRMYLILQLTNTQMAKLVHHSALFRLIKAIESPQSKSCLIEIRNSEFQQQELLEFEVRLWLAKKEGSYFVLGNVYAGGIRVPGRDNTITYDNLIQAHLHEEKKMPTQLVYPLICKIITPATINRPLLSTTSLPSNCASVDSSTLLCDNCDSSYYLDASSNCQLCNPPCDTCSGPTTTDCLSCLANFRFTSFNECLACGSNQYLDANTCVNCIANCDTCALGTPCITCSATYSLNPALTACSICDTSTNNYIDSSNICQTCPTGCATCSSATICNSCSPPYVFFSAGQSCVLCDVTSGNYLTATGICAPCNSACKTCNGNPSYCLSCPADSELLVATPSCRACLLGSGEYYDPVNQVCKPCNSSCLTCSAQYTCTSCQTTQLFQDNTCGVCDVMNSYYIDTSSNRCLPCYDSNCLICTDGLQTSCTNCKPNMAINWTSQLCSYCPVSSDPSIFASDSASASCKCTDSQKYIAKDSIGIESCLAMTNTYISGYFCDSATRTCSKCTDTKCNQCNSSLICLQCNNGYFLAGSACATACPVGSTLIQTTKVLNTVSSAVYSCQCKDEENSVLVYENSQFQCTLKLAISSLKAEVNTDSYMNSVILCLNRVPLADEYTGITIELKTTSGMSILSKGSACQKIVITSNGSSQCIARVVSVSLADKCIILTVETSKIIVITQINVTSDSYLSAQLDISSLILLTAAYNASHTYDTILSSSLSSLSNTLAGDKSIALLDILKYLQLLCIFSNFIQVLAPLVLLFNSLPVVLKSISATAASFIFQQVPDFSTQTYTESASTGSTSDSTGIDNSDISSKLFQSLGLSHSIYYDYIFLPHLIISITCCILIFCITCRLLMKGKQYTVEIFTFLLNFQASFQQGSLTFAVLSIAYSVTSAKPDSLIVSYFTLLCHIILQILIIFSFHYFPQKTLHTQLPNLLLNLIPSARGFRYYLTFAFIKKYLFLIFIIAISPHSPFIVALLCTILFGIFTMYLAYFRFFSSKIFLIFKILQEFLVTVSFCLLTACIKIQTDILQEGEKTDEISADSLDTLSKMSFVTAIFFSICLLLSFLRFFSSTLMEFNGIITRCMSRFKQRQKQQKQLEIELNKLEVLQSDSNYLKAALEIFFKEKAKENGDDLQNHFSFGHNNSSIASQAEEEKA